MFNKELKDRIDHLEDLMVRQQALLDEYKYGDRVYIPRIRIEPSWMRSTSEEGVDYVSSATAASLILEHLSLVLIPQSEQGPSLEKAKSK